MSRPLSVVSVRKLKPDQRAEVVYVGRACGPWPKSRWANPVKILRNDPPSLRAYIVEAYISTVSNMPRPVLIRLLQDLYDSTGKGEKPLGCWCGDWPPADAGVPVPVCHAVELAKLVNAFRVAGVIQ